MSMRMQSIAPGGRSYNMSIPSCPSQASKTSVTPSLTSCRFNTVRLIWLSSQQSTLNPLSGAESSSDGFDKNTRGTSPRHAFGAVIPSMTGIARLSSCLSPRSTERAVMKHRKMEPSPTVDATSIRPACSSHRSLKDPIVESGSLSFATATSQERR